MVRPKKQPRMAKEPVASSSRSQTPPDEFHATETPPDEFDATETPGLIPSPSPRTGNSDERALQPPEETGRHQHPELIVCEIDRQIELLQEQRRKAIQEIDIATNMGNDTSSSTNPSTGSTVVVPTEAITQIFANIRNEDKSIPRFSGGVLDWPVFIRKYKKTTKEFKISDDVNRNRLDKALHGDARNLVLEWLPYACLVDNMIQKLEDLYGGRDNIELAAAEALRNIENLHPQLKNIARFTLQVTKVQLMLKLCGLENQARASLTQMVKLMPVTERINWAKHQATANRNGRASLDDFVEWLNEIRVASMVEGTSESRVERRPTGRDNHRYEPYNTNTRNRDEKRRGNDYKPYRPSYAENRYQQDAYRYSEDRRANKSRALFELRDQRSPKRQEIDAPNRQMFGNDNTRGQRQRPNREVDSIDPQTVRCLLGCSTTHSFNDCPVFQGIKTSEERFDTIRIHKRCPYCTGNHFLWGCDKKSQ